MADSQSTYTSPRPFVLAPDPDRYFPASAIEESRRRITRAIERAEGPALLIGGTGTGKTMVLEVLKRQFQDNLDTVSLAGAQLCTRRAVLQSILFQLGLPYRNLDEGELRLALLNHLQPRDAEPQHLLVLVDEADSLPTRLLEELRGLTNISSQGKLLVGMVLVGSGILEERFTETELEAFSQRVSHRCYLAPFSREETFQYLRAQVAATGIDPNRLFASEGLEAIFTATDGVPRLVNQLGDQLVWMVEETGYLPIDAAIVQQAWSDLQQLPAPWNLQTIEPFGSAVEYGELTPSLVEDSLDGDDLPALIPISGHASRRESARGIEYLNPSDSPEELVEQFAELTPATVEPVGEARPFARNPFAEEFESEEVVIDHYLEFEDTSLITATRVFNQLDATFAQELLSCEPPIQSAPSATAVESPAPQPEPAVFDPWSQPDETLDEAAETAAEFEVPLPAASESILIVEDERPLGPAVVAGRNFRQLFTSLETASRPSRFA
jgi:type II secretory pathway predicted ATPase ExeA